jgi:hypothetical protein
MNTEVSITVPSFYTVLDKVPTHLLPGLIARAKKRIQNAQVLAVRDFLKALGGTAVAASLHSADTLLFSFPEKIGTVKDITTLSTGLMSAMDELANSGVSFSVNYIFNREKGCWLNQIYWSPLPDCLTNVVKDWSEACENPNETITSLELVEALEATSEELRDLDAE